MSNFHTCDVGILFQYHMPRVSLTSHRDMGHPVGNQFENEPYNTLAYNAAPLQRRIVEEAEARRYVMHSVCTSQTIILGVYSTRNKFGRNIHQQATNESVYLSNDSHFGEIHFWIFTFETLKNIGICIDLYYLNTYAIPYGICII